MGLHDDEGTRVRVFMLGWEFPPFISGGLGTACYGLTKALDQLGVRVTFVLPKTVDSQYATHVRLLTPQAKRQTTIRRTSQTDELTNVSFRAIMSPLRAYATPETYNERIEETLRLQRETTVSSEAGDGGPRADYAGDLYREVHRYASMAMELAKGEEFDVVHAHDWMTYPAGVGVAAISGKPLVVHIHSTEFDRSGEHVNQTVYDIEREGMQRADKVIAVSHYTRGMVISRYGIPGDKIDVVYNGVERAGVWSTTPETIRREEKIVLFLGRITLQKGPEFFLHAAKKVLDVMDNVKFVMAGSGDLMYRSVELAAQLGIGNKVLFTGFLRGDDVRRIFRMADLYVMPSVSEPFGIAPLEALDNDVPVIISKQSGVSEVLRHALKVDFWDVDEMANKIVAVLKYPPLRMTLRNHGNFEVRKLRWRDAAQHCLRIYEETLVPV
ncbi:MAG TPA: glycosyltransferase family 4 protein [Sedimentisphaerales bacterium]|jgi:glycosyltransferase involved in cell wall biosynthesis|nr:glycosyltransferase family 4 protein [Sedimentisphaerales bacterium]HNU30223.1 glycosyltransferase family 4 protein [Sedimentisphaerales bacterium]